jgi:hypothetical protein
MIDYDEKSAGDDAIRQGIKLLQEEKARAKGKADQERINTAISALEKVLATKADAGRPDDAKAIAITAEELVKDYEGNEVAADGKYRGKTLDVKGVVLKVSNERVLGNDKQFVKKPCVYLKTGFVPAIMFYFEEADKESLAKLAEGTAVVLRGKCTGKVSGFVVTLSECQIKEQGKEAAKLVVTKKNYDKIKEGMTPKEVEEILGPGKESVSNATLKIIQWIDGFKNITLSFTKDGTEWKVSGKVQVGID